MSTIALWAILWISLCLVAAALFSMTKERDRVFLWKDKIAEELYQQFNVEYRIAYQIVDDAYPDLGMMYKTDVVGTVQAVAMRLFWFKADESGWMPHHFNRREMPEALYKHPSWGGIIVEA